MSPVDVGRYDPFGRLPSRQNATPHRKRPSMPHDPIDRSARSPAMRRALTTLLLAIFLMAADDPVKVVAPKVDIEFVGPMEVHLGYFPHLDEKVGKAVAEALVGRTISYYEPQWVGDEALPRGEPLGRLRIAGARLTRGGATIVLATDPHPRRAIYVLDWLGDKSDVRNRYLYSGVEQGWHDGPEGAPPRVEIVDGLDIRPDIGVVIRVNPKIRQVTMRTTLLVPKGKRTLLLKGNMPFEATLDNNDVEVTGEKKGQGKPRRAEVLIDSTGASIELTITLPRTEPAPAWEFTARWKEGDREVPIPASQLALPWLPVIPPATKAPEPPYPLDGGDPAKGAEVFASEAAKCVSCHAIGGKGGAIGPSLDGLKDRDLAMIYRDIAEPSTVIVPEYLTYTVARKDGQIAVGIVRAEGFDSVRVADINGKFTTIPKSEIEEMRPSTTSTMPVGLAGALGEEKMRDLLAYLRSGKK